MGSLASENTPTPALCGPLSQYPLFKCRNIDEACEQVVRNFGPYKLQVLAHDTNLCTQFDGLFFKGIALLSISYGASISVDQLDVQRCHFAYTAHTMLSGHGQLHFGGRRIVAGQGTTLVTSPAEQYHFELPQGTRRLAVMFEEQALRNHLSLLIDRDVTAPIIFDLTMGQGSESGMVWYRTLNYMCTQLARSQQLLNYRAFMHSSAEMLMSLLLEMQPNNYSKFLQADPAVNCPKSIRRAVEYIEEHIRQPLSLAKLSAAVGMSARVLQKGFRRHMDCTPTDYIRKVRLQRTHEALQQADPDQKVSEILYKQGVVSLGHFGQLYRQKYGCTPGKTLKKRPV